MNFRFQPTNRLFCANLSKQPSSNSREEPVADLRQDKNEISEEGVTSATQGNGPVSEMDDRCRQDSNKVSKLGDAR